MFELLFIVFILAFDFLLTAGLVWVACWLLGLIGITVVWTWLLAFVVWGISKVIKLIL